MKKNLKVLLIEDSETDARLIREYLDSGSVYHFQIENAKRLSEGIKMLLTESFNVILLDLSLPDSVGFDTFDSIRAKAKHVPIVVLTGLLDESIAIQTVQKGAQDYLIKDQVEAQLLSRSILYAIERNRMQAELEKAWKKEQSQQENMEAVRSFQHYLAILQDKRGDNDKTIPNFDDETLRATLTDYRQIVRNYVRAVRIRERRPSEQIDKFAGILAAFGAGARDVVRIHLAVLNEYSQRAMPDEDRNFSNDARLVLVELMGKLLDIYRSSAKARLPEGNQK